MSSAEAAMSDPRQVASFSLRAVLIAMAVLAVLVAPIGWLGELYVVSLVISGVMLALVLWGVFHEHTAGPVMACGVPFVTVFAMYAAPVAILQGGGTALILILTAPWSHLYVRRAALCVAVMVVAYGYSLVEAYHRTQEFDRLRESYPSESLAERLPPPPRVSEPMNLTSLQDGSLNAIELHNNDAGRRFVSRGSALEMLHRDSTRRFVASAGFGVMRMPIGYYMREEVLAGDSLAHAPTTLGSAEDGLTQNSLTPIQNRLQMRFFDPESMGHIEDRTAVVGFQPHGIRDAESWRRKSGGSQAGKDEWRLDRLELIGMLRQEQPVVYVMEGLPSMDRVAGAETRPLNEFEASAMPELATDQDLVFEPTTDGVRMVGAIRAAKHCTACHEAPRGALLGAFSYTLTRVEAPASSE